MNAIQDVNVFFFRQEESFGFHSLMVKELAQCNHGKFVEAYRVYQDALNRFDVALKPAMASPVTVQLTALDEQRDHAFLNLLRVIRAAAHHFKPEKAEAAHKIEAILNRYGDPRNLPYIQESGTLENLLQDLSVPDIQAALAIIDATDWKEEIQRANSEFTALFAIRNKEQAGAMTGLSKQTRIETDNAYRDCIHRFNAIVELEGKETYATLIDNVNRLIEYQKSVLKARKTHSQKKRGGANEETGK